MDKIKKILCPIDLTAYSHATIHYAEKFGEKYNVTPELLYVSTKPPEVYYRFFPDAISYLRSREENVQHQVKKFAETMNSAIDVTVRHGDIYQEILSYANELSADVIVMHANSYSTIKDRTLGLIAHKVIRKADCPVLTLYQDTTWQEIRHILCPLDLSSRSYEGLEQALKLAEVFEATLHVLHVVELEKFDIAGNQTDFLDDNFSRLSDHLKDEIHIPNVSRCVKIEKVVMRNSDAATGIMQYVEKNGIDLIALAPHGHGYWPRVLLGSVTEKVIENGPCPVLTLRLRKGEGDEY
ncbi:universal stress protein [candidate division KSB1 bacterium]|nr:universal stress protein [candidate division KSB1 bacterium]